MHCYGIDAGADPSQTEGFSHNLGQLHSASAIGRELQLSRIASLSVSPIANPFTQKRSCCRSPGLSIDQQTYMEAWFKSLLLLNYAWQHSLFCSFFCLTSRPPWMDLKSTGYITAAAFACRQIPFDCRLHCTSDLGRSMSSTNF